VSFKGAEALIKSLEQQLLLCDSVPTALAQEGAQLREEIESHFKLCEQVLSARKAELLNECAQKINEESTPLILFTFSYILTLVF